MTQKNHSKYIVGTNKPVVQYIKTIPLQQALEEDGDYLPIDMQGYE